MTKLLVKLFIKDYNNVSDIGVRNSYGILGSAVGIAANLLLFFLKLLMGTLASSVAVTADAFNNLTDAVSSVLGFIGVKLSSKPADEDHPFGHGRIEYLITLTVACIIMLVGWSFLKESFASLGRKSELVFSWLVSAILAVSILVKVWLSFFDKSLGKCINSGVLMAAGMDAMGDVLATSATLISMFVLRLSGVSIDGYIGLLVAALIIYGGIGIIRDTLRPILGEPVTKEVYDEINNFVAGYDGVVGTHDLIVHDYGPTKKMASIHAEVPREQDVIASHELIDKIEVECKNKLGIFLVIHMDPIELNSPEVNSAKKKLKEVFNNNSIKYPIHDFRIVTGETRINVIFDMVVPYKFSTADQDKLKCLIGNGMKEYDSRYCCVITFDKSFIQEEND